ncbi:hypothetical protein PoB_001770800 [Plakobranchus ocellatus]|uniref:Uncharacterized protein n=1 Tax=Plakobranchus ocellatus TaxID=259542 RepID=A0AAV3Z8Y4_9GAST|nr:hypothetical protein PoB_001770800 [Plakobranchus ocellatus]
MKQSTSWIEDCCRDQFEWSAMQSSKYFSLNLQISATLNQYLSPGNDKADGPVTLAGRDECNWFYNSQDCKHHNLLGTGHYCDGIRKTWIAKTYTKMLQLRQDLWLGL